MSWLDPLRNYCERSGPGLWDEPLNAFSNLAFFIAAWALWRRYKTDAAKGQGAPHVRLLIVLLTLVGIGSTLFHTFANKLAMLGDVIPIALFTYAYLWTALRLLVGLSHGKSVVLLAAFTGTAALMGWLPPALRFNNSADYFPCLGALFLLGAYLYKREPAAASLIIRAACCFTASIIYRSIDLQLCAVFPLGTHFIWHSINGWMLYLLVRAVMPRA